MGLGFSFGAEDAGITDFQGKVEEGFVDIEGAATTAQKKAGEAGKTLDEAFDTGLVDDFASSMSDFYEILEGMDLDGVERLEESLTDAFDALEDATEGAEDFGDKAEEAFEKVEDQVDKTEKSIAGLGKTLSAIVKAPLAALPRVAGAGLTKVQGLGEAMGTFNKMLGQMKMQTFLQSLEAMKDKAAGLGDALTGGINLTTGLEAEMASLGKAARAQGAQMGYAGKQLNKFTKEAAGIAYSLNVGEESAAQAVRAFDEAGDELEAMGFKSAKAVAKLESGGVAIDSVRNASMRMTRQLKMSTEQVGNISRAMLFMGDKTGDVPGAINMMNTELTELAARRRALGDTPEQVEDFMIQVAEAGVAMFQFNQDSEQTRQLVMGLATSLTEANIEFSDLFGGIGADAPQLLESLAVATGDVNTAMELMTGGPADFMKAMSLLDWSAMEPDTLNFLRAQLSKALDPTQAEQFLLAFQEGEEGAGKAAREMMEEVRKSQRTLDDFAGDAHRTGRTLQEIFDRAKDSFVVGFRKHGREAAREFVRDTTRQFREFNKTLSAIVEKGGPMASMVTKMSEMHQIGALALVPRTLRPMATVMGTVVNEAAPMVTMLGSMGFQFKHLLSPMGLFAAGVLAVGVAFKTARDDAQMHVDTLMRSNKAVRREEKAIKSLEKKLTTLTEGTVEYDRVRRDLEKKQLSVKAAKGIKAETKALENQRKALEKAEKKGLETAGIKAKIASREEKIAQWRGDIQKAADERTKAGIKETAKAIVEGVKQVVKMLPGLLRDVAGELWKGLRFIADEADKMVASLWEDAWEVEGPGGGWEAWWDGVFDKLFSAGDRTAKSILPMLWDEIIAIFDPNKEAKTPVGRIIERMAEVARLVVGGLVKSLAKRIQRIEWGEVFKAIGGGAEKAYRTIASVLGAIPWDSIFQGVFAAAKRAWDALTSPEMGKFVSKLGEALGTYVGVLGSALVSLFDNALDFLVNVKVGESMTDLHFFEDLADRLPGMLESAIDIFLEFLVNLPEHAAASFGMLGDALRDLLPKAVPFLIDMALWIFKTMFWDIPVKIISSIPELVVGIFKMAWKGIEWFGDAVMGLFEGVINWVAETFPSIGEELRLAFGFLDHLWETVKLAGQEFFVFLGEQVVALKDRIVAFFYEDIPNAILAAYNFLVERTAERFAEMEADLLAFGEGVSAVASAITQAFFDAITWLANLPELVSTSVDAYIVQPFLSALDGIGTWFTETLPNFFSELGTKMYEAGEALIRQFVEGIKAAGSEAVSAVTDTVDEIKSYLPFSEPKNPESPLRGLAKSGAAFVTNFLAGMQAAWPLLHGWFQGALQGLSTSGAAAGAEAPDVGAGSSEVFEEIGKQAVATFIDHFPATVEDGLNLSLLHLINWKARYQMELIGHSRVVEEVFDKMSQNIQGQFVDMWSTVLEITAMAVEAITEDVDAVADELGRVAAALARVKAAKEIVRAEDMAAAAPGPALMEEGQDWQDALFQATHSPNWYWKDYVARFERLISQVANLKTGGAPSKGKGGRTARAARSRDASQEILGYQ